MPDPKRFQEISMNSSTKNAHLTRTAVLAVGAAAAALALSACSASAGGSGGTGTSATPGSSSSSASGGSGGSGGSSGSGGGTSATGTSATGTSATGTSATGSGSNGSAGGSGTGNGSACATSQLSVAQVNPSVGAGQYYSTLVFTNKSSTACTLSGYPGVSYVVANGVQSGNPAVRNGGTVATVTLAPGGKADSVLHDSNGISGYSPQQCQLTAAQGLRIYPPNNKAALFLPWKTSHCAGLSIHPLSIGPVTTPQ
jgi:Protein of unknown function (DUF4232)